MTTKAIRKKLLNFCMTGNYKKGEGHLHFG